MNGSVNLLLDNSIYCNDLKPHKKAPCLSEPINPIPSDAFFITKRSTFLNVLKKLLSIDEHFQKLYRIDLRNNQIHMFTQVEIEDIENLNKKMHSKKLHLFEKVTPKISHN
jgi:hypothetical protein